MTNQGAKARKLIVGLAANNALNFMHYFINIFVQLAFNISTGATGTLESSSILMYSKSCMGLYTQMVGKMPC